MPKQWVDEKGQFHRDDAPAVIFEDGTNWWCCHGQFHRDNGSAIEYPDGSKEWYHHGQRHRKDGPAIELAGGTKTWYCNGKLHRDDGPAVENPLGESEGEWWRNDRRLTHNEIAALQLEIQRQKEEKLNAELKAIRKAVRGGLATDVEAPKPYRPKKP